MSSDSILSLINKIAKNKESAIAVVFGDNKMSYSELEQRSDKFARKIINRGIKPGSILALGLYNDIDLISSLLAIWKANCIYLPIDPNYPFERIEMMFEAASPAMLITKRELQRKFSCWKDFSYFIDEEDSPPIIELRKPELSDLAYIMYTSGSTGKPKGISVDHAALKHSAIAYNELHSETHIALVAGSISFDPSLLTIVSTLAKGGTLCLYNNRDGIDISRPQDVIDVINTNLVSFILCTPSFYAKLIQQNKVLASLKNVDLCGEDIAPHLVDLHTKISPHATLYNVYGPTEYAMGVTASLIYNAKKKKISRVTIGKPFSANKIYILDPHLKRVNSGKKGEIYVGGPGLARGYFKQEVLTQQKFLLVEHLESSPLRLYRTGDMGYFLPNGEVVFTGRTDLQVKINGHRVELEEVETFIAQYPRIEKAVALILQEQNENRLVAFFSGIEKIRPSLLKDFLTQKLPPYMIPSKFIQINDWPLTSNGKVDKKALENIL